MLTQKEKGYHLFILGHFNGHSEIIFFQGALSKTLYFLG